MNKPPVPKTRGESATKLQSDTMPTQQSARSAPSADPWRGFKPGLWQRDINVRWFLQQNYTPYEGDGAFLAPPTERTRGIWQRLQALFVEERKKGVLDISQVPSSITAHAPGYIDRDNEVIVGLQTDAPLKRAIMPNGGLRMVLSSLKAYGYEPDPAVVEVFTKYRKTHNEGVFRRLHRRYPRLSQLAHPDRPARRLRPRPDHRRLPAGGAVWSGAADSAEGKGESGARRRHVHGGHHSRPGRAERTDPGAERIAAMATSYGFDISGPARTAREAVQWLYFAYLAAVKEQNGAAMSLGRTSTFLDIYFERDLDGRHAHRDAGPGDHRRLRHQAAHRPLPAHPRVRRTVLRRPDLGHRVHRRHGRRRPVTGDEDQLPVSAHAVQPRAGSRAQPDDLVFATAAGRFPAVLPAKVAIDTSSLQFESDEMMRRDLGDDGAIACCVSPMTMGKQMQFFGARANLAKCLLYAINGGRDELTGEQVGPVFDASTGDYLDFDDVLEKYRADDGVAGGRLRQRHERHPLHARQVRLRTTRDGAARLRARADDGVRHRRPLGGGRQPVSHALCQGASGSRRDGTGHRLPDRGETSRSSATTTTGLISWPPGWFQRFMSKLRKYPTYRNALHTQSVLTITSNVVYGKNTGPTPDGRLAGQPFAPGANPMHGRDSHGILASAASVAKIPYRDAADGISLTTTLVPVGSGPNAG